MKLKTIISRTFLTVVVAAAILTTCKATPAQSYPASSFPVFAYGDAYAVSGDSVKLFSNGHILVSMPGIERVSVRTVNISAPGANRPQLALAFSSERNIPNSSPKVVETGWTDFPGFQSPQDTVAIWFVNDGQAPADVNVALLEVSITTSRVDTVVAHGFIVSWDQNTEPDFNYYNFSSSVNDGPSDSFSTTDTEVTMQGAKGLWSVSVTAVDTALNESRPSELMFYLLHPGVGDTTAPAIPSGLKVKAGNMVILGVKQ